MGKKLYPLLMAGLLASATVVGDNLEEDTSWSDVVSDGESLVFGRLVGKFDSAEFRSRRVRLRDVESGDERFLEVDEGLGFIAETIPPGTYRVEALEAVYYPRIRPFKPDKYRPIRQRYLVSPKTGDAAEALIVVPPDRPVYIGTIQAAPTLDGVVYRGHQLRVLADYEEAYERLGSFFPAFITSLEHQGVSPGRSYMLKPTRAPEPLERVVGLENPLKQAREYISEGKFRQAVNWLETFMPISDDERNEARLLVGEALLGDRHYTEAIEELGEVLVADPRERRALRLLARAHAFEGNLESAQNLYEALAEQIPEDAEAHLHLGYLYALKDRRQEALRQFAAAFQTDFDYLLHDVAPFFVAMRAVFDEELAEYEPPRVVRYEVDPPRSMDSRRAARTSSIAVLIDHEGEVIAAQLGAESSGSAPAMMLSLVKARYQPASLNGIPCPALLTLGGGASQAQ